MGYSKATIKYAGSVSGDVTTVSTDQTITMQNGAAENVVVGALAIKCVTDLGLRINNETNYHEFSAGDTFNFEDVAISSIEIREAAAQIKFSGLIIG